MVNEEISRFILRDYKDKSQTGRIYFQNTYLILLPGLLFWPTAYPAAAQVPVLTHLLTRRVEPLPVVVSRNTHTLSYAGEIHLRLLEAEATWIQGSL